MCEHTHTHTHTHTRARARARIPPALDAVASVVGWGGSREPSPSHALKPLVSHWGGKRTWGRSGPHAFPNVWDRNPGNTVHEKQRAPIPTTHDVSNPSTPVRGPNHPRGAITQKDRTGFSDRAFYPFPYLGFLILLSLCALCHGRWHLMSP